MLVVVVTIYLKFIEHPLEDFSLLMILQLLDYVHNSIHRYLWTLLIENNNEYFIIYKKKFCS